jgi:hypothetical protein
MTNRQQAGSFLVVLLVAAIVAGYTGAGFGASFVVGFLVALGYGVILALFDN